VLHQLELVEEDVEQARAGDAVRRVDGLLQTGQVRVAQICREGRQQSTQPVLRYHAPVPELLSLLRVEIQSLSPQL
jgi:hypothetical protein